MIEILKQVSTGTTYKTVLHRQMAHYNQIKTRAAHDIVRGIINDTELDYDLLRNWLDNIGGKRADEQIIATYLQQGDYTNALSLANLMPDLYAYENIELTEHNFYLDMLNLKINLAQSNRSILDLDETELSNLVSITENSNDIAGVQAKSILEFAYDYYFCNCIEDDENSYKSSNSNTIAYNNLFGPNVSVSPNPASTWIAFDYTLQGKDASGNVKITNVTGKVIDSFIVNGNQGQHVWDTRMVDSGVYFYTFTANGLSKTGKFVISK